MSTPAATTTAPTSYDVAGYTALSQPAKPDAAYSTQGTPYASALIPANTSNKSRLDDAIYFSKKPAVPLVPNDDPYQFNHWV